jgi:hypothetical protein
MKLIISVALMTLHFQSAFATPQEVSYIPQACQTYTDGDLEQALSCVNALYKIEMDRIQYNEDRTSAIYNGVGVGAGVGAGIGMIAGNMTNSVGALSHAGLWELANNSAKGAALGAGIGAVIGGALMFIVWPSELGANDTPSTQFDSADGFEYFLQLSPEEQMTFINEYNPIKLIGNLHKIATIYRDTAIQD